MSKLQAVILAAGSGTRLHPLTLTQSKAMMPIANKPMLEWTVNSLKNVAEEVVIVANPGQSDVISYFSEKYPNLCTFTYQKKQTGTADALNCARESIRDRFILMNADEFFPKADIEKFASGSANKIATFPVAHVEKFAAVETDGDIVTGIVEKPHNPKTNLSNAGMYMLNKNIFPLITQIKPSPRGEL